MARVEGEHRLTWSREGGHSLPHSTRERIRARDGGRCRWRTKSGRRCGSRDRCQVDHDVPVFEGGTDDDANLRLLCHDHHARKTASEAARAKARTAAPKTRPPELHPGRRSAPVATKKTSGGRPAAQGKKPGAKAGTKAAAKGSAAGGRKSSRS